MTNSQTNLLSARSHAGFSMIDVLVAIVVLATALLALAALQGALTRNSADARARSQVAAYTEGLVDQLRAGGYDNITDGTSTISPSAGTTAQKATASTIEGVAGINGMSTTVSSVHYYGDTGSFITTAPASIDPTTPEYKQLNMTTTWTDASGQSRSLKLGTIISPVSVESGNALDTQTLTPVLGQTPVVREFNPGSTAGVIPIAIGSGSDTAATNPQPDLVSKGRTNTLVGTTFNVLTFTLPDNDNETVIQQRVENRVIRCSCNFGTGLTDTTDVFTQPYRPTYWGKDAKYVAPTKTTAKTSPTGVDSSATQDEFCDVCCRDHNDAAGDIIKFDPFTSDYKKYRWDTSVTPNVLVEVKSGDPDAFLNACRLIRVDGQFAVATDMQNYFFGLLATSTPNPASSAATSPNPDTTDTVDFGTGGAVKSYQNFVTEYLTNSIPSIAAGTGPDSTATAAALYAGSKYNLDRPTNITITFDPATADNRYLHARGVYVDHLETETVDAINSKCLNNLTANCVLPLLPFTTINLTELANWTVTPIKAGSASNVNNEIQVSDTLLIGGITNAPLRGVVNSLATSTNNNVANAVATVGLSNSGVTGEDIVDAAVDKDDQTTLTDSQQFTISRANVAAAVTFTGAMTGIDLLSQISNQSNEPSLAWSGTATDIGTASSGTCPVTITKIGNGQNATYTPSWNCIFSSTVTRPNALTLTVQKFNQTINPGTGTETFTGTCGTVNTATQCLNYDVATVTINGTAVAIGTPALLSGTTDGGLLEGRVITIPNPPGLGTNTSSPYDAVSVGFTLTGTTIAPGQCALQGNRYKYTAGTCSN